MTLYPLVACLWLVVVMLPRPSTGCIYVGTNLPAINPGIQQRSALVSTGQHYSTDYYFQNPGQGNIHG